MNRKERIIDIPERDIRAVILRDRSVSQSAQTGTLSRKEVVAIASQHLAQEAGDLT